MANHQRDATKEQYWREVIGRQGASGLSAVAFCRQEALPLQTFYVWRRTLREWDAVGNAQCEVPAFVPAVVTEALPSEASIAIELASGCMLRFSGTTVAVH
jgi:hypothetical protein